FQSLRVFWSRIGSPALQVPDCLKELQPRERGSCFPGPPNFASPRERNQPRRFRGTLLAAPVDYRSPVFNSSDLGACEDASNRNPSVRNSSGPHLFLKLGRRSEGG